MSKNIISTQKEIELANKDIDNCTINKCKKSVNNIEHALTTNQSCQKKFAKISLDNFLEKIKKTNKCLKNKKVNPEDITKIVECGMENCKSEIKKIEDLNLELLYLTHPQGKKLKKLQTESKKLIEKENQCRIKKCGNIYPLDKLKLENEKCNSLFSLTNKKQTKYDECVKKYNIYEKNIKIANCKKEKCSKIVKKLDKTRKKIFKINYPNQK
jgi:hypothetical protein